MKVTGYKLMQSLKELAYAKETAEEIFDDSLWKFEKETKISPEEAMQKLKDAETAFATVQAAQALYNQSVKVNVQGKSMPLSLAVKLVGGAGRIERKWRMASKMNNRQGILGYNLAMKKEDNIEYARKTIEPLVAMVKAKEAAKYAAALREAVQVGNAVEQDIMDLDPKFFE